MFSYFCEFLPSARRGTFLVGLAAFWMIGQVVSTPVPPYTQYYPSLSTLARGVLDDRAGGEYPSTDHASTDYPSTEHPRATLVPSTLVPPGPAAFWKGTRVLGY